MIKCSHCGQDIPQQPSHNRSDTIMIELPIALLASLEHAFAIARNTAGMSREPMAAKVYRDLTNKISQMVPVIASKFDDGNWTEMLLGFSNNIDITLEIVDNEKLWKPSYFIEVTGPKDIKWPHGLFQNRNKFRSEEFSCKQDAQKVLDEIIELRDRLTPMKT